VVVVIEGLFQLSVVGARRFDARPDLAPAVFRGAFARATDSFDAAQRGVLAVIRTLGESDRRSSRARDVNAVFITRQRPAGTRRANRFHSAGLRPAAK